MYTYDQHERSERAVFAHNRALLFAALQARGIVSVTVLYEGSGDSGDVEDVTVLPDTATLDGEITVLQTIWGKPEPEAFTRPLKDIIDNTAMQLATFDHAGWENNEGGGGEVEWDVVEQTISVEHYDYYVERTYASHQY